MLNIETQFSNVLIITLQVFVPIALAAIAGAISERSGVINLGLEGMMLIGAFVSAYGSFKTGNPYIGVLFAIIGSVLLGLLHGVFCIKLKAHQSVVGVGINIFAAGLTAVLLKLVWGNEGTDLISR